MRKSLSIAIWMAVASMGFKLALFGMHTGIQKNITYTAFFNIMVISIGTFFAIRKYKIAHRELSSYKEEVKAGLRVCAVYSLIMTGFVYFYYSYVDTAYFASLIQSRVEAATAAMATAEEGQTIDLENIRQTAEFIFSPRTHATITMFGFLVAGTIYSMLITFFMRKFPGYR